MRSRPIRAARQVLKLTLIPHLLRSRLRPSLRFALMATAFTTLFCGGEALASGGVVKLKTYKLGGYYYNANGTARARYCSSYNAGELDPNAIICGIRLHDLDQSKSITAGVDDYILRCDLRSDDPLAVGYANIGPLGLIATADANSASSCSTTGGSSTQTFGGGAGIPDPGTRFVLTASQPANNDVNEGLDFCGIILDTFSVFVNSARTQNYAVTDGPLYASIGFNHFVEAVVFEPKPIDLQFRMTGSSRFPGDRGLPIMFARRACLPAQSDCFVAARDGTDNNRTDDLVTARIVIDNNRRFPDIVRFRLEADRRAINPKLEPKDVLHFFRSIGGGGPVTNPIALPVGRTILSLEIRAALARRFFGLFPLNIPFLARIDDPNEPNCYFPNDPNCVFDVERELLGIRPDPGYYDNNEQSGGYYFSQIPVQTGDNLSVRFDAIDLQNRANTPTPYRISALQ